MKNPEETKKLVSQITDYVNTFSLDPETFNETMSREHRTLQQSFTRLCLAWIEHCASDEYRYDLRNEDSHTISKTIVDSFKKAMKDDSAFADLPNWLSYI